MNELESSSWRRGKAIAFWSFRTCERQTGSGLPVCPKGAASLSRWLVERIRIVARVLSPFASLEQLMVETRSGGEEAFKLRGSQASILRKFEKFAERETAIVAAHLTLILHCKDMHGTPFDIASGARVVIEPSFDGWGDVKEDEEVNLRLTLDVDIYSPRNPCTQPDNTHLALVNGPLLSDFIARLQAEVPCQFELASGDEYKGFISSRGFDLDLSPMAKT